MANDADAIRSWKGQPSTGIRIEPPLEVSDFDITDQDMLDTIKRRIFEEMPGLAPLVRYGGGVKEAWFFRLKGPAFPRFASRQWFKPDDPVTGHRLEDFGGGSARHFGAYGPHRP